MVLQDNLLALTVSRGKPWPRDRVGVVTAAQLTHESRALSRTVFLSLAQTKKLALFRDFPRGKRGGGSEEKEGARGENREDGKKREIERREEKRTGMWT